MNKDSWLRLCWCCFCLLMSLPAQSQDFEAYLEDAAEYLSEEELSHLYDELFSLWENPLDLNHCSDEDIQSLPILSNHEKEALLDYLHRYRPLDAIAELLLVPGWTPYTLQKVRSFMCLNETAVTQAKTENIAAGRGRGRWQVTQRFNYRLGADVQDSLYRGSLWSHAYRLSYQQGKQLAWSLCFDKDEGERWGDHCGGYIELRNRKHLPQLIVGDYRATFGQGLILSAGSFGGKSQACTSLLSQNKVFRPQSSWTESAYWRGFAAMLNLPSLPKAKSSTLAICSAWQKIDSNLKDSVFTSLKTDGLHRYDKDMDKRSNVQRSSIAMRYQAGYEQFQWATNALFYHFDHAWQPEWQAYNMYYFRGKSGLNISADWRYRWKKCFWGGEFALDQNGQTAFITHLNVKPQSQVDLFLSLRRFARAYQAPFAATFSEKSMLGNEEGVFLSGEFQWLRNMVLRCYVDAYRFPWLRYGVNAPSLGWDAQVEGDWKWNDYFRLTWRYKEKYQQKNLSAELSPSGVRPVVDQSTRSARGQLIMDLDRVRVKSLLQWTGCEEKQSICYAQEIKYEWSRPKLSIVLQHALFEGDTGLSSYLYSNELAGSMPFVNLSGRGQYVHVLLSYRHTKWCQWHLRANLRSYDEKSSLSSIGSVVTFKF